ncbi:MAG: hypothetical protein ACYDAO_10060 [Thermoplasmataceae archaeon]
MQTEKQIKRMEQAKKELLSGYRLEPFGNLSIVLTNDDNFISGEAIKIVEKTSLKIHSIMIYHEQITILFR